VILFVVFQICRTTVTALLDKSLILKLADMFKITELSWYLGYFVLGYILVKYGVSGKVKIVLKVLIPVGIWGNYIISDLMSRQSGVYSPGIYDSFGIFTFAHSVALFVFVNDFFAKREVGGKTARVVSEIALATLGVYVMHVGLLDFFRSKGFIIGSVNPVLGSLLLTCICFVLCGVVAALLRRIPFVGKYIC